MLDEPDEQDVRTGMDSYCVVTADQGTAHGAATVGVGHGTTHRVVECIFSEMPDDRRTSMDLHEQPGHLTRRLQQANKLLWWAELVADDLTSPQFVVLNLLEQHPDIGKRRLSRY
ncbi:hypothetical protein K8Z49_37735 [Actinomadura madurae]|uniref:hypothetical protein n=1 Tax=Actinomadura madurae TaxID=1993 RepID=UPI00399B7CD9